MNKIAFKVKKAAEKSILQGHPWVYESSIIKQSKDGQAGDLAIIFDQRRNKLLAIGLYDPASIIRVRILHVGSPREINKLFFEKAIENAKEKRISLLKTETTAYRLIYGENDGLSGLIIDIYNQNAVIKLYSEIWFPYLSLISKILQEKLKIETTLVRLNRQLKKQNAPVQDGEVIFGQLENEEVVFFEHGLKFKANLIMGHKTGYFLDHRHNRLRVRSLSKDKRVLDIFAYAGGFSINALAGGAQEVTSIDISKQALQIAEENAQLNFNQPNHKTMAIDAFKGMELLSQQKKLFDLIIIDPPSFAKSEDEIHKATIAYKRLVRTALPILAQNGILLMASCSSRIDKALFFNFIQEEIKNSGRPYQVLDKVAHDVDHPEGIKELSYLKSIYLKVQ